MQVWRKIAAFLLLSAAAALFFWPQEALNIAFPPYLDMPPSEIEDVAVKQPKGGLIKLNIESETEEGEPLFFSVMLSLEDGADGQERLENSGLFLSHEEENLVVIADLAPGSNAEKAGLKYDNVIRGVAVPQAQPDMRLVYIPAVICLVAGVFLGRGRKKAQAA